MNTPTNSTNFNSKYQKITLSRQTFAIKNLLQQNSFIEPYTIEKLRIIYFYVSKSKMVFEKS
jgi:hypothetical protein